MAAATGERLYWKALIGGSLGFVTFGWDAGVLGGVLLTDEFQSAMGVRDSSAPAKQSAS